MGDMNFDGTRLVFSTDTEIVEFDRFVFTGLNSDSINLCERDGVGTQSAISAPTCAFAFTEAYEGLILLTSLLHMVSRLSTHMADEFSKNDKADYEKALKTVSDWGALSQDFLAKVFECGYITIDEQVNTYER